MGCEDYRSALTDAALGAPMPSELAGHLAVCPRCRIELGDQRRLVSAIDRGLDEGLRIEPSPVLAARVRRRLAAEPKPRRGVAFWVPALAALAAALVGIALLSRGPEAPRRAERVERTARPAATLPGASPTPAPRTAAARTMGARPAAWHGGLRPAEVLVAPGQSLAVLLLEEALRGRRVEASALLASGVGTQADLPEPQDLTVRPLEAKPLALARLETKAGPPDAVGEP